MPDCVLDASALLALLGGADASGAPASLVAQSHISAVNLAEVVDLLTEEGMPRTTIREALMVLGLTVHPFDQSAALVGGGAAQLSLGARAALGLARQLSLPLVTEDPSLAESADGVEIRPVGRSGDGARQQK